MGVRLAFGPFIGRKKAAARGALDASQTSAAAPKKRPRKRISVSTLIALAIVLAGAGLIAYPTFADWWNNYHQYRAISEYVQAVEDTSQEDIDRMLDEAHAYNQRLVTKSNRFSPSKEDEKEYNSVLNLTGTGVIGYIQIHSIGVNLPIYHGVGEDILQMAIGHIEGSSFPVGGPTTHAVVSGHRGLPSAKLFTDLDKLVEGDTFTITVLTQTITYEVDQIRIVEPQDMSDLNFIQDGDYVTLVTCTPYGVNTHRLLVRAHRIENLTGTVAIPAEGVQIPSYIAVPAVAIPMLFIYLLVTLIYYRLRGPEVDKDKALAQIREFEEEQVGAHFGTNAEAPQAQPTTTDTTDTIDD